MDFKKLFKLFLHTLYLSAFTFGGGYVILSLMESTFVKKLGWINKEEMLDMTAIAQSAPGAVAINASISVGYKLFGFFGALVATLGTLIPPLVIISVISYFYNAFISNKYIALILKGMQAGVGALIINVVIDMSKDVIIGKGFLIYGIFIVSFVLNVFFDVNIIYIITGLILFGIIYSFVERKKNMLIKLFISFFKVGLFFFGGGYAALPLIQEEVVNLNSWLSISEFNNLITISQMTPGPIAINSASFVGTRVYGLSGAIVASLGCVTPSFIIVGTISYFYNKYRNLDSMQSVLGFLRPAVVSMILAAGIDILKTAFFDVNKISFENLDSSMVILFFLMLLAIRKTKIDPIILMIGSGLLYLCINLIL